MQGECCLSDHLCLPCPIHGSASEGVDAISLSEATTGSRAAESLPVCRDFLSNGSLWRMAQLLSPADVVHQG